MESNSRARTFCYCYVALNNERSNLRCNLRVRGRQVILPIDFCEEIALCTCCGIVKPFLEFLRIVCMIALCFGMAEVPTGASFFFFSFSFNRCSFGTLSSDVHLSRCFVSLSVVLHTCHPPTFHVTFRCWWDGTWLVLFSRKTGWVFHVPSHRDLFPPIATFGVRYRYLSNG